LFLFLSGTVTAQYDLSVSQYMYNRYAVNKAFGGSREALSLYGSFRKKWAGINGSPVGQYFSGHTPLKNDKIALGLDIFNQKYAVSQHTGFSFSYTYRIETSENTWLGFALSGGGNFMSANWSDVSLIDDGDMAFSSNESSFTPIAGFGISFYSDKFFAGVSIPSFFVMNEYDESGINFDMSRINYIATAGYAFTPGEKVMLQPSFLAQYDGLMSEVYVDINITAVFNKLLWAGISYRTSNDIIALLGYQITPQLRFGYSFDYSLEKIGAYNAGTHEVSIQYDFNFKIKSPNPRFF